MSVSGYSVTIRDLVFDGNKAGSWNSDPKHDLEFTSASWNNYVLNSVFKNAPDKALNARYYTYIQYCNFYDAEHVGILTAASGPTDIGIYTSYFTRTGANAVYFQSGLANSIVYDSEFFENHKTCSWNSPGGQILIDYTTNGVWIQNNDIDGNFSQCTYYTQSSAGVETEGEDHVITGNLIKRHRWWGIYGTGASSITITYNTVEYNGLHSDSGVYDDGIRLFGGNAVISCAEDLVPAPSSPGEYTITNNTIQYNYGYGLKSVKMGCDTPSSSTITESSNTYTDNGTNTPYIE